MIPKIILFLTIPIRVLFYCIMVLIMAAFAVLRTTFEGVDATDFGWEGWREEWNTFTGYVLRAEPLG